MDPAEVEQVKARLTAYRTMGHFASGAEYHEKLSEAARAMKSIAIEICLLYLVQGQLRLAAAACDAAGGSMFLDLDSDSGDGDGDGDGDHVPASILDQEAVAFELLRAFVWIVRYSKLHTALKIARKVNAILKFECHRTALDNRNGLDDAWPGTIRFSEYRVLMELFYWKIVVVAADQGLLDIKSTRTGAVKGISALRQKLESEARWREARSLVYFEFGCVEDKADALALLQRFACALGLEEWQVERAMTLIDIGQLQIQSKDASIKDMGRQTLREAQEILIRVSHGYGSTEIDLILVDADELGINCLIHSITPQLSIGTHRDAVARAMQLLEDHIESTGSEILKQLSLIHATTQAGINSSEYGFALQSLETYLVRSLPEEIGFNYHANLYKMLASVYSSFGEHAKAVDASERAFEIANSGVNYEEKSDVAFYLSHRLWSASREVQPQGSETRGWFARGIDLGAVWAEADAGHGYKQGEMQKSIQIARWKLSQDPENPDTRDPEEAQRWVARAKGLASDGDIQLQYQILELEIQTLSQQKKLAECFQKSQAFLRKLTTVADVPILTRAQAMILTSIHADSYARGVFAEWRKKDNASLDDIKPSLLLRARALEWMFLAVRLFRQTSGVELIVPIINAAFGLLYDLLPLLGDRGDVFIRQYLGELEQTEKICDDMRRSVIPVDGVKSLMAKRLLVAKQASIDLYRHGVSASLRVGDASKAWVWLQKGKARAFNDSLGAHSVIPEALLRRINEDAVASELLREEQSALDLLGEPQINYVLAARRLAETRKRMADNPLLAEALRMKDETLRIDENLGDEVMRQRLQASNIGPEEVAFVDWYIPPAKRAGSRSDTIVLFCRRLDGTTHTTPLPLSVAEVTSWLHRAFAYPDLATPPLARKTGNRFLQQMSGLLEGLGDYTKAGDLLVLSPSGLLNGIPLHALKVKGELLLQRNLVVYASSTSTLCQCLSRACSRPPRSEHAQSCDSSSLRAQYFAVYEEPLKATERRLIFEHVDHLATKIPGDVSCGPDATPGQFLQRASGARWVHYHGHARYDATDVMKSSLVLSNGNDVFSPGSDDQDEDGIDELDVLRLFDAALPAGGAHYTVIACDSGTQNVGPGDEPLGIIPSLLHAGATSVLGCLWPIDSRSGRAFSKAFYDDLSGCSGGDSSLKGDGGEGGGGGGGGVFQLARASRGAAMKMAAGELGDEFKQPYHWASFSLHGLWYLPC
ncbi:tetratricopeptide repeat [Emericellopsis cladophorae]|uniref:Tetratricopeptide repeat n=1 Tax=Emericellopsis cladophorae TaxID=2686198 RepID=A0A9P9XX70_9HYPO|nr:tetratricopeptide repeat [Emericellopsis cladophorae]KAI6779365.1 tetratricopeptide repeat [Emericellopsis cladophorae]